MYQRSHDGYTGKTSPVKKSFRFCTFLTPFYYNHEMVTLAVVAQSINWWGCCSKKCLGQWFSKWGPWRVVAKSTFLHSFRIMNVISFLTFDWRDEIMQKNKGGAQEC